MADGFGGGSYDFGGGGYSYGEGGAPSLGSGGLGGVSGPFDTGDFGGSFGSPWSFDPADMGVGGVPAIGGYQTGQWSDPASQSYDNGYAGGRSFGDSIQETLKRLLRGFGTRALGQRAGPLAGPIVAAATAPEGQRMGAAGRTFAQQAVNGLLSGIPVVGPINAISGLLGGPSLGGMIAGMARGQGGMGTGESTGRSGPGVTGFEAAMNVLSGLDGMRAARGIGTSMAPFDQYRGGFAARAAGLEANPRQLMNSPGYRAGLQAVQRALAAQGYTGSGNAAVRIAEFGNDFFNRESARLANLGGAGAAPGAGSVQEALLRGQGLAAMAKGLTPIFDYLSQEWGS